METQNYLVLSFSPQLYKGRINATSHMIQHPMYGAGHKYRTLHLPISTTLAEVLDRVSGMFQYRKLDQYYLRPGHYLKTGFYLKIYVAEHKRLQNMSTKIITLHST